MYNTIASQSKVASCVYYLCNVASGNRTPSQNITESAADVIFDEEATTPPPLPPPPVTRMEMKDCPAYQTFRCRQQT